MSHGIFCRKCKGVYPNKREYNKHICPSLKEVAQNSASDNSQMDAIALFEEGVEILTEFVDDDDCRLDHHGYCQTHGWFDNSECINKQTKRYIEKLNAVIAQRHH